MARSCVGAAAAYERRRCSSAADFHPPLTTVRVPRKELGRTAVRLAVRSGTPTREHVMLGTHLVIRDSVTRPAG